MHGPLNVKFTACIFSDSVTSQYPPAAYR